MADGLCDWQGCIDEHVRPAILRVDREPGDEPHIQPLAVRYELCPLHQLMLVDFVQNHAPIPFDPEAGD